MPRSVRRAGALLPVLAALLAAPLHAQEEGLFELRLTALAESRTVSVLLDPRGQPLVPLRAALDYLQIPVEDHGDTLALQWPPGVWSTRISLSRREVSSGRATFTVPAAEWLRREREVYLSPGALGRVLAAEVSVEWENVSILFAGRTDFPAVRRAQDAARREGGLRSGGGALLQAAEPDVPYPARNGGWTASWGVSGDWGDTGFQGRARAALGAALLGGSIEGGGAARFDDVQGAGLVDPFVTYERGFPRSTRIRQLQLGDVLSDGLLTRPFFGVAASNEPVYAPRFFGQALIRPVVPAGWEYEVYQGEYLVGVSTPGSRDPVPTPVGYGTTPVRVRMLGPAGQERTEELVFLVPAVQVPAGEWRWYAGAGACRTDDCRAYGYADLRRGVSRTLTLGAGVDETVHRDSAAETHPYGLLVWNPWPALSVEARARAGSFVHLALQRYDRWGGWRVAGGWKRQEGFSTLAAPQWFTEGAWTLRLGLPGRGQLVSVQARTRGREPGAVDAWQTSATSGYGRVQVTAAFESGFQARDVATLQAHLFLPRYLFPSLRDLNLSSRVDWTAAGVQTALLGATFRPGDRANVSLSAGWNGETKEPELALAVVARTPSAYLQANGFSQGARRGAFFSAGGGVALGAGGVEATPFEAMGRGGVAGRVFLDENGNGVMDPGERPAPGVPVVVGGERAASDSSGEYRSWGLLPYAVLQVAVDTLNLTVTDVAPAVPEYLLRPTPNAYTRIDLPLLRTREAAGRVRWRGTPGALGGITVEIRHEGDREPRRAVTFSDGEFYVTRLPAGEYTLTVAASSLRALGASTDPPAVRFTVPAAGGAAAVEIPAIYLRRP
ncbi:MAG: hypothetical protein ACJ8GN_07830 [Longimicrobiaceae bacterium]